jgi:hypothetical protein
LYEEAAKMQWQTTDEIREWGDRRTARRRTAIAASAFVAVVVLAGGAIGLARHPLGAPVTPGTPATSQANPTPATSQANPTPATSQPDPTPSVSRSDSPSPSGSAVEAPMVTGLGRPMLLQSADAGGGTWDDWEPASDWQVEFTLSMCPERPADRYASTLDQLVILMKRRSDGATITQAMAAYPAFMAAKRFAELQAQITACADFASLSGNGRITVTMTPTSSTSFIVKITSNQGTFLISYFRSGNLLSEIETTPGNEDYLIQITDAAKNKLCVYTAAC